MGTRNVKGTALVVIDVQVDVMKQAWEADRIVERIGGTVRKARAVGVPLVWIQHADEELQRGSAGWELMPSLTPAEGEQRVDKNFNSSFEETDLVEESQPMGTP